MGTRSFSRIKITNASPVSIASLQWNDGRSLKHEAILKTAENLLSENVNDSDQRDRAENAHCRIVVLMCLPIHHDISKFINDQSQSDSINKNIRYEEGYTDKK